MSAERGSNSEGNEHGRRQDRQIPQRGEQRGMSGDGSIFEKRERSPRTEAVELKEVVRGSVDRVVQSLSVRPSDATGRVLGTLSSAIATIEGIDAARQFATDSIETLSLSKESAFDVWVGLHQGSEDTVAFTKARQVAASSFLGDRDMHTTSPYEVRHMLSANHNAGRLVSLVEIGDIEAVDAAREITQRSSPMEQPALFGRLYRSGDIESLDLAIEAAGKAKAYTERNGDRHTYRVDMALEDMARYAVDEGEVDDALKILDVMQNKETKALLHTKLFGQGRSESLQPALEYLEEADGYMKGVVERSLAEARYLPLTETIRKRATNEKDRYAIDDRLADLETLYKIGDESAAQRISDLVHAQKQPKYYLDFLWRVGLEDEAKALATRQYEKDPSPQNAQYLLDYHYDTAAWGTAFEDALMQRNAPDQAAEYITLLASRAKELQSEE